MLSSLLWHPLFCNNNNNGLTGFPNVPGSACFPVSLSLPLLLDENLLGLLATGFFMGRMFLLSPNCDRALKETLTPTSWLAWPYRFFIHHRSPTEGRWSRYFNSLIPITAILFRKIKLCYRCSFGKQSVSMMQSETAVVLLRWQEFATRSVAVFFLTCHSGAGGSGEYRSVSRLGLIIGNRWMSRLLDEIVPAVL